MKDNLLVWLEDIERSILEINTFIGDNRDFKKFQKDLKTKRAIERNIEIIGEAMNRVLRNHPEIKISSSRKIVDTRNRIIHGYDDVSDDILWLIVLNYLPILKEEINRIQKRNS